MARTTNPQIQPIQMVNDKAAPADLATNDWFWEGNVVDVLVQALSDHGCSIISVADTHSKQQGIDIHAMLGSQGLLIEVKGYPSHSYRDPRRASETKRTNPTVQAQHWYAQALLKALRLRFAQPEAKIAIGLPDMPRYRALFAETGCALEELGVGVLFVDEQGSVDAHYITLNC